MPHFEFIYFFLHSFVQKRGWGKGLPHNPPVPFHHSYAQWEEEKMVVLWSLAGRPLGGLCVMFLSPQDLVASGRFQWLLLPP